MSTDINTIKSKLKEFHEISLEALDPSVISDTLVEIAKAAGLPQTAAKIENLDWDSLEVGGITKVVAKTKTIKKPTTKTKKTSKTGEQEEEEEVFIKLLNGTIGRITGYPDEETALVSKGRGRPSKIPIQELEEVDNKKFQFKQIEPPDDEEETQEDEDEEAPKKRAKKIVPTVVKKVKVKIATKTPAKPTKKNEKDPEEGSEESDWE